MRSTVISTSLAWTKVILVADYLLGRLPPLMLTIGGSEVLLGENLKLAQRISAAGGVVQLEVYEGMCVSGNPVYTL